VLLLLSLLGPGDACVFPVDSQCCSHSSQPGRAGDAFVGLGHDRRTQEKVVFGDFRNLAYYYADVFVGTPPQRFTVIADTWKHSHGLPLP